MEESPSVIVSEEMREAMGRTAVEATRACGYVNAGTIEFLVDQERKFYFLEMNTRLQVEHPVTELRTGLDLVAEQLKIAAGMPLSLHQEEIEFRGHAIECRICAEDVDNDFLPSTGRITHLRAPTGPGIREDRGIEEGGEVPVYYDSLISKLIAWAPSREQALGRMERALSEYQILGVKTNIPLCLFVIRHPEFRAGRFTTHFLSEHFQPRSERPGNEDQRKAVALVCALLEHHAVDGRASSGKSEGHDGKAGWKSKRLNELRQ